MVSKALHVNISNMQSSENGQSNGDAMYSMGYSGQTAIELNWTKHKWKKWAISMGCVQLILIMAAILGYKMKNQLRITINHLQLVVIK